MHRVVIIGGGFGGLYAAQALKRVPVQVTLVDRRNFHLFQPLLYQVATGGLSPADICAPLRSVVRRQQRTAVVMAEVTDIDPRDRRVLLRDGELGFDTLVVAAGACHHYFGNDHWAEWAPGLKTVEDATRMRSRILRAFESAERARDPAQREALMTFLIVGGGPTGVELAGAIGELARHTLRKDFRHVRTPDAKILLVEGFERILPGYPPRLSAAAKRSLERLGVRVETRTLVSDIEGDRTTLKTGDTSRSVRAATVLWAAGVQTSPLARVLAERAGAELDRAGRVHVACDCSLPGHPEILVIGDMCRFPHQDGAPLPGVAPVAMQQGSYVARLIHDRLQGHATPPFRYRNRGNLAVIGRASAVADLGWVRFTGYPAWLLWLFVHIMYLVEFGNRLVVFVHWAYSYFTRKRGARLITLDDAPRAGPGRDGGSN
jgi:NADH dehydrogenase